MIGSGCSQRGGRTSSWRHRVGRSRFGNGSEPRAPGYNNQRSEPLLATLMDRPGLIAHTSLGQILPLSEVHDPRFVWRAMEPVDLLQSAGRWADAVEIARHVEERQPSGAEGEAGRLFSRCFVLGAVLLRILWRTLRTPTLFAPPSMLSARRYPT